MVLTCGILILNTYTYMKWSPGSIIPPTLILSALVALTAVFGTLFLTGEPVTDMYLTPSSTLNTVGESFTLDVMVSSLVPVNVFAGEIRFDPSRLRISSIDYNISIADLWAEKPWYVNGEGTLAFGGGTTRKGGFFGTGNLLTITFEPIESGDATVVIDNPRILLHDGMGTDAELKPSIDAIITVQKEENLLQESSARMASPITITKDKPKTDLNGDGKQSIADMSIFMMHLATNDLRSDFNDDGTVNTADLSLLLSVK